VALWRPVNLEGSFEMATTLLSEPDSFTNLETLRTEARKHVEDGPVTRSYPEDRDIIVAKLSEALATEWVCVLRYMRHYFCADGLVSEPIKAHFMEHATEEQAHANMIADRIVQLGSRPDLNPDTLTSRSHAEYREGKTLRDMVKEDLIAERIAIESYRELIAYIGDRDTTTKKMLEHILSQEENHADEFRDLLAGWEGE
jgi:bacterioferritin